MNEREEVLKLAIKDTQAVVDKAKKEEGLPNNKIISYLMEVMIIQIQATDIAVRKLYEEDDIDYPDKNELDKILETYRAREGYKNN